MALFIITINNQPSKFPFPEIFVILLYILQKGKFLDIGGEGQNKNVSLFLIWLFSLLHIEIYLF